MASVANRQVCSGPPERRRLIHHQTPAPPAAMTSSSHGHQVVPASDVGAWAVGVADWVVAAVVGVVLAFVVVCALGETGRPVGLRVARWVVAVAVVVVVAVAVAVVVAVSW